MTRGGGNGRGVRTVADAMLRHPTVHRPDLTVAAARAAFEASPKTHLLLLVDDVRLVGTLTRGDLASSVPGSALAPRGLVVDRVVGPDAPLDEVRARMVLRSVRRLAVVDDSMRLLGLLCLKRSGTGFCTDDGVAAMRAARHHAAGATRGE